MNQDNSPDNDTSGQSGIDQETERRNRENETGEQAPAPAKPAEGETGFVGSSEDKSSDYLTKGENQDFAPEGQGATDSDAGTSDIETGQSSNVDATLDDGADTSQ